MDRLLTKELKREMVHIKAGKKKAPGNLGKQGTIFFGSLRENQKALCRWKRYLDSNILLKVHKDKFRTKEYYSHKLFLRNLPVNDLKANQMTKGGKEIRTEETSNIWLPVELRLSKG